MNFLFLLFKKHLKYQPKSIKRKISSECFIYDEFNSDQVIRGSVYSLDISKNIENPEYEFSLKNSANASFIMQNVLSYDDVSECKDVKMDGIQYQNKANDSLSNYVNDRCNAALDEMFQFFDESNYELDEKLNCVPAALSNIYPLTTESNASVMKPSPDAQVSLCFNLQGIFDSVETLRKETAKLYHKVGTLERSASLMNDFHNTQSVTFPHEIDYDVENSSELKTCFELNLPIETMDALVEFEAKLKDTHFRTTSVSSMIISSIMICLFYYYIEQRRYYFLLYSD